MTPPPRQRRPGGGRGAVVTGASRGVGRACAVALGRAGYDVVVGGYAVDDGAAADAVEQDVVALFDRAEAEFGGVDAVAHAAGRMTPAPVVDLDVAGLDHLHRTDIRGTVNAVAPGPTATDLFLEGESEEQVRHLARAVPLERLGQPGDIAGVVGFLCSPAGRWVNGQVIRVHGGLV